MTTVTIDLIKQKIKKFYIRYLKPRSWKHAFFVLGLVLLGIAILLAAIVLYYAYQVPDTSILMVRHISESTKIYDRTGEHLLYDVHGEEKRTVISWDAMPESIKKATLASEDSNFYNHGGIDIKGILRALYRDVTNLQAAEGGSTITQQLVKNALVGKEKKLSRKIKEAILSIQIERAYSKDQIFWMYLNQIPYGSNAYGIEAASQTYFGKSASQLTFREAATLASLVKAPSYYSPYGAHTDQLANRTNYVLKRMLDLSLITDAQYQAALHETLALIPPHGQFEAPHFITAVLQPYLSAKYGEDLVQNGGLKVLTTIDWDKQKLAEDTVKKYGIINEKSYKASNAALVAVDPKTGQLLSMVGSRDFFGTSTPVGCTPGKNCKFDPSTNVATRPRQPGSSFKPFAYATAFMKGYTDSTILFDLPTEFNPSCSPAADQSYANGVACYNPRNYSGTFTGPVTMRQALDRSLNIPSVETLYLAGIDDTVTTARSMGITLDPNNYYGLSLVLGGAEVSLYDMVSGYSVFANDGIRETPNFILKISSSDGAVLEEYKPDEERAIPAQIAHLISDVLSDNNARAPVFGFNSALYLGSRPVAAKTGTTQNNRDGWLIGYTPSLAVGVWTGNNDDTPMTAAGAGLSAAGPMWKEFMTKALQGTSVEYFTKPDPVENNNPMYNGDYHGPEGIHSILYYVNQQDPQFPNWEYPVRVWVNSTGQNEFLITGSQSFDQVQPQ